MSKVKIFLSHKVHDRAAAHDIHDKLERFGAGRLDVFICEDMTKGAVWRNTVIKELREADYLIFLYTDSAMIFDWCLYETGFFDGKHIFGPDETGKSDKKLIVLHGPTTEVPGPLDVFQKVVVDLAKPQELNKLIEQIYLNPEGNPINEYLRVESDDKKSLREAFVAPFGPAEKPVVYDNQICVQVTEAELLNCIEGCVPEQSVVSTEAGSLHLFGFDRNKNRVKWKELIERLDEIDQKCAWPGSAFNWTRQLGKLMRLALHGKKTEEGLPLFFDADAKKSYRPSIFSMQRRANGTVEFKVNFTLLPPELHVRPEGNAGVLTHMLGAARMFRWGLLDNPEFRELQDPDERSLSDEELVKLFEKFELAMSNIRIDLQNRGLTRSQIINALSAGKNEEERRKRRRWIEKLVAKHDASRARLEEALRQRNRPQIQRELLSLRDMNHDFFIQSIHRYAEFVEDLEELDRQFAQKLTKIAAAPGAPADEASNEDEQNSLRPRYDLKTGRPKEQPPRSAGLGNDGNGQSATKPGPNRRGRSRKKGQKT